MSAKQAFSAWLLAFVTVGCAPPATPLTTIPVPPAATAPGPETNEVVPTVAGYVVLNQPPGRIIAVHLPTLKETIVRPEGPPDESDPATIHTLSGPDAEGRVAYIEDHFFVADKKNQRHLLKTIKIDGSEDAEMFSRPGNAMWAKSPAGHGEIGNHLALSPARGKAAFLSNLVPVQMPSAYLYVGNLEIWDVKTKTGGTTSTEALDEGLAWFPDGKRLAFVKLAKASSIPKSNNSFGKTFGGWTKIPSVFLLDLETKTETFLHVGWRPVVSSDGSSVLVSDNAGSWRLVVITTGNSNFVSWPGMAWTGAIAQLPPDVVLSWSLPTSGSPIEYTQNNSPLRGPKEMLALKLVSLNSGKFQTVVPYVDPRTVASFGIVTETIK